MKNSNKPVIPKQRNLVAKHNQYHGGSHDKTYQSQRAQAKVRTQHEIDEELNNDDPKDR